jgi:lysozyme
MKKQSTSEKGIALIKKFEGFLPCPYLCFAGVPTIGYGNTFYEDGRKVTLSDKCISEKKADRLLRVVVQKFENGVNDLLTTEVGPEQFSALVSFSYNVGLGALRRSTLLKKVNANPCDPTIGAEFLKWNKAGGKVLKGLTRRRTEEVELYFS